MQKRTSTSRAYSILVVCCLLYFFPFLRTFPQLSDEGTLIYGAERIVRGQVPYRDFFEVMGPGTFYWQATFFHMFGVNWLATRIDLLFTSVMTAVLLYFIARRLNLRYSELPVILFFATAFGLLWPAISHHADSNVFALACFAVFLEALDSESNWIYAAAGCLAAITTCFLQPKGGLVFVALLASTAIVTRKESGLIARLVSLSGGYTITLASVAGYFWFVHALPSMVYATFIFPLTEYKNVNSVTYGMGLFSFYGHRWFTSLSQAFSPAIGFTITALILLPFLFIALLPLHLGLLSALHPKNAFTDETAPYWLVGCAIWLSELHRKDIMHLVYGSSILIVLCFYLLEKRKATINWCVLPLRTIAAALALFNVLAVCTAQNKVETRRGNGFAYKQDTLIRALNARISPGEEIFAYPYRPLYYFLLDAPNATRFSFLLPGYNTESQYLEVVHALETKETCHVLWDTSLEDQSIAWAFPTRVRNDPVLEPYLRTHYHIVEFREGVRLLERNSCTEKLRTSLQ